MSFQGKFSSSLSWTRNLSSSLKSADATEDVRFLCFLADADAIESAVWSSSSRLRFTTAPAGLGAMLVYDLLG